MVQGSMNATTSDRSYCKYCKKYKAYRGFSSHKKACKKRLKEARSQANLRLQRVRPARPSCEHPNDEYNLHFQPCSVEAIVASTTPSHPFRVPGSLVDISALSFDVQASEDVEMLPPEIAPPDALDALLSEPQTPPSASVAADPIDEEVLLRTSYHPRRCKPDSILSLDRLGSEIEASATQTSNDSTTGDTLNGWNEPWAPFSCRADFEVAERITKSRMSNSDIDDFLKPLGPGSGAPPEEEHREGYQPAHLWYLGRSLVSMRKATDYHRAMTRAREYIVKVSLSCSVSAP
jgi:hypothetical protein